MPNEKHKKAKPLVRHKAEYRGATPEHVAHAKNVESAEITRTAMDLNTELNSYSIVEYERCMNHAGNTITVNYNGSVASAFY